MVRGERTDDRIRITKRTVDAARPRDREYVLWDADITGFGLVGHAFEMAEASDVCLCINATAVPLMADTLRLARDGVLTRAHKSTLSYVGSELDAGSVDDVLVGVLSDAQTSGGLLIAVAANESDALVAALIEKKTHSAAVIGEVRARSSHAIVLA